MSLYCSKPKFIGQYVEIYKLKNDGSQQIIVVYKLVDNKVIGEGDQDFISNLEQTGIIDYADTSSEQRLFSKDGLRFLEQLKFNFKSAYLSASDIKEKF